MATAAPPKIRVPVRDGERWSTGRAASRSGTNSGTNPPSKPSTTRRHDESVRRWLAPFLDPLRLAAFWLAVTLPVFYLPLVLAPRAFDWPVPGVGLAASSGAVVAALVALHLAAIVVGHGYARRYT